MTDIYYDIDPVELTGFAREAAANLPIQDGENLIEQFCFPVNEIDDLEFRVKELAGGLEPMATYRSFDAESPIAGRQGFSQKIGEIPPISRQSRVGEYQRLRLRKLDNEIAQHVYADTEKHVAAIRARIRYAQWELARTGKVTMNENGFIEEYDWERDVAMDVVPGGADWDVPATADPSTDELNWVAAYARKNGFRPGLAVMNSTTHALCLKAAAVRDMAPRGLVAPSRISDSDFDRIRAEFNLPPVTVCDALVNDGSADISLLPDGEVLYLPPAAQKAGETLYGTTAESLELEIDSADRPGLVAVVYKSVNPVAIWTNVAGIAVPVAPGTNRTMRATVVGND